MKPIRVVGREQKLMDFLHSEEGNAVRSKVLATGAVLGGSVLAQMLLATPASADPCSFTFGCNDASAADKCDELGCVISWANCPGGEATCHQ